MSTLKVNNLQVGQDATASNNFTLYQPAVPDGTVRLGVGNSGSVTDTLTVSGGNIGIGTISPTTLLDIVRSSTSGLDISMPQLKVRNTSATQGNGSTTFNQSFVQVVSGNGAVSSLFRSSYDSAGSYGTGVDLWVSTNNYLRIGTNNQERLRVNEYGNVGIGLVNPQDKLDVSGAIITRNPLQAHQTSCGVLERNGDKIALRAYGATTGSGFLAFNVGGGNNLQDTEAVRIASNGNVGIGTTNPSVKLEVYDSGSPNISLKGSNFPSIRYTRTSGATAAEIYYGMGGNDLVISNIDSGIIAFATENITRLKITPGGDLHSVWNDGRFLGSYYDANYYMGFTFGANARELYIDNKSSDTRADIVFRTREDAGTPIERLRVRSNGNVGVGTSSPTRKLDVEIQTPALSNGTVLNAHPIAEFINFSVGSRGLEIGGPADSVSAPVYLKVSGTGNRFAIVNQSDSEQLTILTNNNVGIGTTNPSKKLHVIGDIRQDYSTRSSGGFSVNPNGGTRTIVISGLQNGCCMFHMGGYSSAGQSQMHECAIMGGFMTATSTYNVTRLASWTNGNVSYTYTKSGQDVTYVITNSSIYTLNIAWYLDDSSFSQSTTVTVS